MLPQIRYPPVMLIPAQQPEINTEVISIYPTKEIIMRNKLIVYILILTLSMSIFVVNTSIAGGGGSCSGEDEKQCLAVDSALLLFFSQLFI